MSGEGPKKKKGPPDPKLLACRDAILELAKSGPGGDWIDREALADLMERRGLTQLFYGPVYKCPFCGLRNPHKDAKGKFCKCESCKKNFDAQENIVREQEDENGRIIVHVRGINFDDDGVPKTLEAPWICPTCRTTNGDDEDVCTKPGCGITREQGNRRVVERGANEVVIATDNVLDGYVTESKEDAPDAIRARDEMIAARRSASEEPADEPVVAAEGARTARTLPPAPQGWTRFSRRQIIALATAGFVGVGSIYYGMQDPPPPTLPQARTVAATVVEVYWEQNVKVKEKVGDNWQDIGFYPNRGDHTSEPHIDPNIPAAYKTDAKRYQLVIEPYYSIITSTDSGPGIEWQVSRERYRNWEPGDKGELRIMDTGRPMELRRVLP